MTEKLLLIAKNWPEPGSTAAGRRTLDLLTLLASQGFELHVASAAEQTPFQSNLTELSIHCHRIQVNDSDFDIWIKDLAPDLVIFDRYVMEEQFGWRVRQQCPDAMTLLDTSDLHCLRSAREIAFRKQQSLDLNSDIALREIAAIVRCDLTLMISQFEVQLLSRHFGIPPALLSYLPFLVDDQSYQPGLDFAQRQHLVMIGGFKHEPNRDATRWLKESLWPLIRPRLPTGTEMHVYGAYADHAMNQLHNPRERFFIRGRAEHALTTLGQYRLNLAPLRFGAGQKGKILEGWLTGTPTITTVIGAEAMASGEQLGYDIPEQAEDFAERVSASYQNEAVWHDLQQRGYDILQQNFSRSQMSPPFIRQLRAVQSRLPVHRHENFWGRMLWQTQFRATEFMSRWIESKNQSKSGSSATE